MNLRGGGAPENSPILRFCNGFTLAEVLITLGIIGVVAAMTIPQLIKSYEKKVIATQAAKFYSDFSQSYTLATAKYGESLGWGDYKRGYPFCDKVFKENMKAKSCKVVNNKVYYDYLVDLKKNAKFSGPSNFYPNTNNCWVLPSGKLIMEYNYNDVWQDQYGLRLSYFLVDVNGLKKPNILHKDIHDFFIVHTFDNKTRGNAFNSTRWQSAIILKYGDKIGIYPSLGETEKLMKDNWTFKKDYPW